MVNLLIVSSHSRLGLSLLQCLQNATYSAYTSCLRGSQASLRLFPRAHQWITRHLIARLHQLCSARSTSQDIATYQIRIYCMPAEALRRRVDDSDDVVPGMMAWTTNALGRTTA